MSEGPEAGNDGRRSLLETLATDKRVLGGVLGVVLLAALLFALNGSSETPEDVDASPGTSRPSSTVAGEATDLEIAPIDGCTLLDNDTIFDALGPSGSSGFFGFSGGEACRWEPDGGGVSIELAPGSPDDFEPGATFHDVEGVPLPAQLLA
jgi:hypothetical protein